MSRFVIRVPALIQARFMSGDLSNSASNASGGAGSIREAGGAFSRMEMAREEQYFYNLQKEEMKGLKDTLKRVEEVLHPRSTKGQSSEASTKQSGEKHD